MCVENFNNGEYHTYVAAVLLAFLKNATKNDIKYPD